MRTLYKLHSWNYSTNSTYKCISAVILIYLLIFLNIAQSYKNNFEIRNITLSLVSIKLF